MKINCLKIFGFEQTFNEVDIKKIYHDFDNKLYWFQWPSICFSFILYHFTLWILKMQLNQSFLKKQEQLGS